MNLGGVPLQELVGWTSATLIASYDDDGLAQLMTNLGGHCVETLIDGHLAHHDGLS